MFLRLLAQALVAKACFCAPGEGVRWLLKQESGGPPLASARFRSLSCACGAGRTRRRQRRSCAPSAWVAAAVEREAAAAVDAAAPVAVEAAAVVAAPVEVGWGIRRN